MGIIKWQKGADPRTKDVPEIENISKLPKKDVLPTLMTQLYKDLGDKDFINLIIGSITAVLGMHRAKVNRVQKEAKRSGNDAMKKEARKLKISYNKFARSVKKTLVDKIDDMVI